MNTKAGDSQSDKDLIARILRGDNLAFGIIVKNTERLVAQIIFKMINDPEDRRDLAQEVYLKAYRKLPGFRFQSKLSTWIAQVSYNTCLDHLKKKKIVFAELKSFSDGASDSGTEIWDTHTVRTEPSRQLLQKDLSGILRKGMNKLPPIYQTLITLYHTEELSYEEIMEITGLPQGTVKNYLFRARRALKEEILSQHNKEEL